MENNPLPEGEINPANPDESPAPKRRRPRIQRPSETDSNGSRVPDKPTNETKPPRTGMESV